jgi:hypothetical protein
VNNQKKLVLSITIILLLISGIAVGYIYIIIIIKNTEKSQVDSLPLFDYATPES